MVVALDEDDTAALEEGDEGGRFSFADPFDIVVDDGAEASDLLCGRPFGGDEVPQHTALAERAGQLEALMVGSRSGIATEVMVGETNVGVAGEPGEQVGMLVNETKERGRL